LTWGFSQGWQDTPVIPALRWLRQEDLEFKASLDSIISPSKKKKYLGLQAQV
jgi:hypothetical protein